MPAEHKPHLWKRKLAAYLHDPPSKCVDIPTHEEHAKTLFRQAGFDADEAEHYARQFAQPSDWAASAADRLPFPQSQAAGLTCQFDGHRNQFHHALGAPGAEAIFQFHAPFTTAEVARETDQSVQPVLTEESLARLGDTDPWQARFFAHWRLWRRHCIANDYRFAFLPADTRIPDHSVWTHMQVVSALDGCADQPGKDAVLGPAFLKFQLGPVQDFIAAARSIRDLWSGSYLLSWLMAAGLKALSAKVGPDAVIFPSLLDQPLFDLHWRNDLWNTVNIGSQTVWQSLNWSDRDLLTPNLPNVFLAVVPTGANTLAGVVKDAINTEWKRIAKAVWDECKKAGLTADEGEFTASERRARFDAQVEQLLSLSWQVTPLPETLEAALKVAEDFDRVRPENDLPIQKARDRVLAVKEMAEKQMPKDHRDGRFYVGGKDGPKEKLNNIGLGWSVILAFNSWQLDAVRQTRGFHASNSGGWQVGTFSNKDALTGRDEAVAGGREWAQRAAEAGSPWSSLFKKDDWLSAATLVKRTWHRAYLATEPWNLKTDPHHFPMPNTRGVAAHEPDKDCDDDETAEDAPPSEKYFAVLAFDGDEIGKWISGENTPKFATQLADYKDGSGNSGFGSQPYFQKPKFGNFLDQRRPLSPSYHLQFSEALSNFALLCARPVVESFDGRLIYAGGDDLVALLPADTALACAQALRMAFQGDPAITEALRLSAGELQDRRLRAKASDPLAAQPPYYQKLAAEGCLLHSEHRGFLQRLDQVDQQHRPIPYLVPGPAADCSVGIAMAHFKAPLQDVVREARRAEKRAKKQLGRSAVAITLMKRSGEIIEWGAKWEGGLELYRKLSRALEADELSSKFPHRFAELLEAYVTETTPLVATANTVKPVAGFPVDDVICREFEHCLLRQRGPRFPKEPAEANAFLNRLSEALPVYLGSLPPPDPSHLADASATTKNRLRSVIGLCQTVAFAHRTGAEGNDPNPEPKGSA